MRVEAMRLGGPFVLTTSGRQHTSKENTLDASSHITIDESSASYDGWRIVAVCFLVATFGWAFGFYGQSVYPRRAASACTAGRRR